MTKDEIIAKLREFEEPITLFGENDEERQNRLKRILNRCSKDEKK